MSTAVQISNESRNETPGERLERQAQQLFQTYRACGRCGSVETVRPVMRGQQLAWGCEVCFPPPRHAMQKKVQRSQTPRKKKMTVAQVIDLIHARGYQTLGEAERGKTAT
jgi:hypothetical protein